MLRGQVGETGFSLFQNSQTGPGFHLSSTLTVARRKSYRIVNLHLVPRLRMNGARPPLSPYAFKVWTGITLPEYVHRYSCDHELADCSYHTTVVGCWWAKSSVRREILVYVLISTSKQVTDELYPGTQKRLGSWQLRNIQLDVIF
jgi:hypothetical protein